MSKETRIYEDVPTIGNPVFDRCLSEGMFRDEKTGLPAVSDVSNLRPRKGRMIVWYRGTRPPSLPAGRMIGSYRELKRHFKSFGLEETGGKTQPTRLARLASWIGGATEKTARELPPGVVLDRGKGIPWWVWALAAATISATIYLITR